jgi:hypothetical protein
VSGYDTPRVHGLVMESFAALPSSDLGFCLKSQVIDVLTAARVVGNVPQVH